MSTTPTICGSPTSSPTMLEAPRKTPAHLEPGVYYIANNHNPDMVLDLAGYDLTTVLVYGKHNGDNQKWEFEKLGAGYSIQSKHNGSYITLKSELGDNAALIATTYPVSWELEADSNEPDVWRIRWPRSSYVFNQPDEKGHIVQLNNSHPFKPTSLWKLIPVKPEKTVPPVPDILEITTSAPKEMKDEPAVVTTADTIVDVEGLKLGGNGEMCITTTTTTVTTSVTKIKRIGVP